LERWVGAEFGRGATGGSGLFTYVLGGELGVEKALVDGGDDDAGPARGGEAHSSKHTSNFFSFQQQMSVPPNEPSMKTSFWPNGQLREEYHVNAMGKWHGRFRKWAENSQLEFDGYYKDGKRHGPSVYWGEHGIKQLDSWSNDESEGICMVWNASTGALVKFEQHKNDEQNGLCLLFHSTGQIAEESYFENDERVGAAQKFDEDGRQKEETE
jgi:antitoxin component YwqK of YwqJK toxin-antitoxin module